MSDDLPPPDPSAPKPDINSVGLTDRFQRRLNYLRVSITDRCNLRCLYCDTRPREQIMPCEEILRFEEILAVIKAGIGLGIEKVRITGGEPLVRRGILDLLNQISDLQGLKDISLTTNGVLLEKFLLELQQTRISRLNISLDSLIPAQFKQITGEDVFKRVWHGIMGALEAGFSPIKINMVVMSGINDNEITDFARLTLSYPLEIRFIEYMPIGGNRVSDARPILGDEILARIKTIAPLMPLSTGGRLDGPAERFQFSGAPGIIGLIRPISHHFCSQCNRLRLTAAGALRSCLLSENTVDIKTALRNGATYTELQKILLTAARTKPQHHDLADHAPALKTLMSAIGG
ncbi:GTP 3',8-cyclase MoaA [Desulfobacterales bacterium HSG17]|nr:GTP 3',8-cyclase MoaA [Desulfobacterales bacterium HSG17]